MTSETVPKLADLLNDPSRVRDLPLEAIPSLRGELAKLDTLLQMHVVMSQGNGQVQTSPDGDRLLDVREAAAKLSISDGELYRHSGKYPFTVRLGHRLRFSEAGIERYIRQRSGR